MLGIHHAGAAVTEQRARQLRWLLISLKVIQYLTLCYSVQIPLPRNVQRNQPLYGCPATVLLHQMQRHFKVGEGDTGSMLYFSSSSNISS